MKKYIVSEEDLLELLVAQARLDCLENDGVDNWDWYMAGAGAFIRDGISNYDVNIPEDINLDFEDLARLELNDYEVF